MKITIKFAVSLFILAAVNDASAMLRMALSHSPQKRLVVANTHKRNCHQNNENIPKIPDKERKEFIETLQNSNREMECALKDREQILITVLKQIEIGSSIVKLNNESIENLQNPMGPHAIYDTPSLLDQFNALTNKLNTISQPFQ